MSNAHTIATKLEEYLDADYFAGAIKDVHALISHIAFLEKQVASLKDTIARTQAEAREKDAWEGRYNALLEEREANRPREIDGDGSDLPAGTVVIDNAGDAWQRDDGGCWSPADFSPTITADYLDAECGPYTIVHTPEEES